MTLEGRLGQTVVVRGQSNTHIHTNAETELNSLDMMLEVRNVEVLYAHDIF